MTSASILARVASAVISYEPVSDAEKAMTNEQFDRLQGKKLRGLLDKRVPPEDLGSTIDYFRNQPTAEVSTCPVPVLQCFEYGSDNMCFDYQEVCTVPARTTSVFARRNCPADALGALACMKDTFKDSAQEKAITDYLIHAMKQAKTVFNYCIIRHTPNESAGLFCADTVGAMNRQEYQRVTQIFSSGLAVCGLYCLP